MSNPETVNPGNDAIPEVNLIKDFPKADSELVKKYLNIWKNHLPPNRRVFAQNVIDRIDNKPIKKKGIVKEFFDDFLDGLGDFK